MTNINNISNNGTLSSANRIDARAHISHKEPASNSQTTTVNRNDAVELSPAARRLSALAGNENTVRPGLVDQIKSDLSNGTYDIDAKLDAALDSLIDRVIAEG